MQWHLFNQLDDQVKFIFPGGAFKPPPNIFDKINELTGLDVLSPQSELATYSFHVTYDIENYFPKGQITTSANKHHQLQEQAPLVDRLCQFQCSVGN